MRKLFLSLLAIVFVSSLRDGGRKRLVSVSPCCAGIHSLWLCMVQRRLRRRRHRIHLGSWNPLLQQRPKEYKFKLSGVLVADVGGAGITAEGEVYNLRSPADLAAISPR